MNYFEILENANKVMNGHCKACPVCNGKACGNKMPGPGAKGLGDGAIRNFDAWRKIRLHMDTFNENFKADTSFELFGKTFSAPIFVGPVGAVANHYGDKYNDETYNEVLIKATADLGIAAFTGDGINSDVMKFACKAIANNNGIGVPTIKPWNKETILEKLEDVKESNCFAIAMDIDAAGLPFLKGFNPPAGSKSVAELKEIIEASNRPFIVKGIMTVTGALKAKEAGASAIVVSNHGGRVLDQCFATAEVLEEIVLALKGSGVKILVDGGIRTGVDVFKALALGADAVLICRPFVPMIYGGAEEGVQVYFNQLKAELEDAMFMCGAKDLKAIDRSMVDYGKI